MNSKAENLEQLKVGQELEVVLIDPDGRETVRDILEIVRLPSCENGTPGEVRSIYAWKPLPSAIDVPWDIAKEAWKLFRECNTPMPPVTSWVLYKDSDPMEYSGAKKGSSGPVRWLVRDKTIKELVIVDYELTLEGAYGARPMAAGTIPQGEYLPKITVIVNKKSVAPFVCVTGDVHLGAPYNVGQPGDDVDPRLDIDVTLDIEIMWIHHPYRCVFVAEGSRGFRFDHWR